MPEQEITTQLYPPVVSVLGHVDHGKTSLLDKIRKTHVTERESGGITQSIGASQITIDHEGKKRTITFVDTPGHLAFANMRSQGVSASDIVLLVVAADDGVMPQTIESIEKIQESNLPYIVVITKIDAEGAQVERVKQQLLSRGVLLEGLGGSVPFIGVSSKTGQNIQELLDLIVLIYDLSAVNKDKNADFLGVAIESKIDPRRGPIASIVVKQGTLKVRDMVYIQGKEVGKVRALFDTQAKGVKEAYPGDAVEILGLSEVLPMGDLVYTRPVDTHPQVVEQALMPKRPSSLAEFFGEEEARLLSVVIRTQTSGELEAIKSSLPEDVKVVFEGQGDITVSDTMLAKDFQAIVLGFHVGITKDAKAFAETENVFYKTYSIIYELLDEVNDVLLAMKEEPEVKILGKASILASFPSDEGRIIGARVIEGRIALNDTVTITREDAEIGTAKIVMLKKGKNPVKEVGKGSECGISIDPFVDFSVGDMLLSHR